MENTARRTAVSTRVLAIGIVVVIAVAAVGAYFVLNSGTSTSTGNTTNTTTSSGGSTSTGGTQTTVSSTMILNGTTGAGLYREQVVLFKYSQNFVCTPALAGFASNKTEANLASAKTACGVGGGDNTAVANASPAFMLVPAYAGLSVFGYPAQGATSQGYPTFDGKLVFTQCGAGGTASACSDHPALTYSPYFTSMETQAGIRTGYGGLPQGVLPTPAHSLVVDFIGGPSIPWYVITVFVFDPNIMPDATTGQCHQVVTSDLTDPTANCLSSFLNLSIALMTQTTATANANKTQSNPIYAALGGPKTQVVIPGVTIVSSTSPANSNLFLYFSVTSSNPYGPQG